jgi:phage gp36-like protein
MEETRGYCTYNDMLYRFNDELLNLTSADSLTEDDEQVIRKCISDATDEMDMDLDMLYDVDYLKKIRHKQLIRICCNLTYYFLLLRKQGATREEKEYYYDSSKLDLSDLASNKKKLRGIPRRYNYKSNNVSYIFDREKFTEGTLQSWENITEENSY